MNHDKFSCPRHGSAGQEKSSFIREREKIPDQVNILTELSNEASAEISGILLNQSVPPHEIDVRAFEDAVKVLRLDVLTRTYAALRAQEEKNSDNNAAHEKVLEESLKIKSEIEKLQRQHNCF